MIGKFYKIILDIIRSIDLLTEIIWKIKIKKKLLPITYDLTSLVIKKTLKEYNMRGIKFNSYLDMGCGQIAILGLFQKKMCPDTEITSADIYENFISNAKQNALANKTNINFVLSDLFSNITNKYDLISFNPPYVPIAYKKKSFDYEKISYAGEDGTDAISKFLKNAKNYMTNNGLIFLGVNLFYVSLSNLQNIVSNFDYKIVETIKKKPHKCIVLVLKK